MTVNIELIGISNIGIDRVDTISRQSAIVGDRTANSNHVASRPLIVVFHRTAHLRVAKFDMVIKTKAREINTELTGQLLDCCRSLNTRDRRQRTIVLNRAVNSQQGIDRGISSGLVFKARTNNAHHINVELTTHCVRDLAFTSCSDPVSRQVARVFDRGVVSKELVSIKRCLLTFFANVLDRTANSNHVACVPITLVDHRATNLCVAELNMLIEIETGDIDTELVSQLLDTILSNARHLNARHRFQLTFIGHRAVDCQHGVNRGISTSLVFKARTNNAHHVNVEDTVSCIRDLTFTDCTNPVRRHVAAIGNRRTNSQQLIHFELAGIVLHFAANRHHFVSRELSTIRDGTVHSNEIVELHGTVSIDDRTFKAFAFTEANQTGETRRSVKRTFVREGTANLCVTDLDFNFVFNLIEHTKDGLTRRGFDKFTTQVTDDQILHNVRDIATTVDRHVTLVRHVRRERDHRVDIKFCVSFCTIDQRTANQGNLVSIEETVIFDFCAIAHEIVECEFAVIVYLTLDDTGETACRQRTVVVEFTAHLDIAHSRRGLLDDIQNSRTDLAVCKFTRDGIKDRIGQCRATRDRHITRVLDRARGIDQSFNFEGLLAIDVFSLIDQITADHDHFIGLELTGFIGDRTVQGSEITERHRALVGDRTFEGVIAIGDAHQARETLRSRERTIVR